MNPSGTTQPRQCQSRLFHPQPTQGYQIRFASQAKANSEAKLLLDCHTHLIRDLGKYEAIESSAREIKIVLSYRLAVDSIASADGTLAEPPHRNHRARCQAAAVSAHCKLPPSLRLC